MANHHIDRLRRDLRRRHYEVAFVLAVLVIGHNDELPRGDVREGCLDAVKGLVHETVRFEGDESARWCKRGDIEPSGKNRLGGLFRGLDLHGGFDLGLGGSLGFGLGGHCWGGGGLHDFGDLYTRLFPGRFGFRLSTPEAEITEGG